MLERERQNDRDWLSPRENARPGVPEPCRFMRCLDSGASRGSEPTIGADACCKSDKIQISDRSGHWQSRLLGSDRRHQRPKALLDQRALVETRQGVVHIGRTDVPDHRGLRDRGLGQLPCADDVGGTERALDGAQPWYGMSNELSGDTGAIDHRSSILILHLAYLQDDPLIEAGVVAPVSFSLRMSRCESRSDFLEPGCSGKFSLCGALRA